MANETALVLRNFGGLDQSKDPTLISYTDSPDCANMDTKYGALCTAAGYKKIKLPALEGGITNLGAFYFREDTTHVYDNCIVAANRNGVYVIVGNEGPLAFDGYDEEATERQTWRRIYTPVPVGAQDDGSYVMGSIVDMLNYQDEEEDVLLLADGVNDVLRWNGVLTQDSAKRAAGVPTKFAHIELNYERVWAAGGAAGSDRVYWSRQFDIHDWTSDVSDPDNGGGYVEIPTWDGGKIRLIRTLFGNVIVFKDNNIFSLTGSYPGEYAVNQVTGVVGPIAARTVVQYGDTVYFLGKHGLCSYNGMSAGYTGDKRAQKWYERINEKYAEKAVSIVYGHMMYIAVPVDDAEENNVVFEYDLQRSTVMVRTGISVKCWLEYADHLLFSNGDGYLYEYGVGDTYDGKPIEAYWVTPTYTMGSSSLVGDRTTKQLGELTAYGEGRVHITVDADNKQKQRELMMTTMSKRSRKRLNIRGRRFKLTLRNVDGLGFKIKGNVTIDMDLERD